MANTIDLGSVEEAKQFATGQNGAFLVLSRETLDHIEAAEAQGGFEGGMSGASGEGGFSAPGNSPEFKFVHRSRAGRAARHARRSPCRCVFEGLIEKVLDIRDVWHQYKGSLAGPVILVPKRELDRWLGIATPDDAEASSGDAAFTIPIYARANNI